MKYQSSFATSREPGRTMASLINAHDWANHPLGEIANWPHALRNIVSTMLASRFPMYLAWGPEGYSLYNDGYIPILSDKHPGALGASLDTVWGELAAEIRALIDLTYRDQSSYFEDMPFKLLRNGRLEQCYFTFSYSSIRGDTGEIEGFYAVCIETTQAFHAKQERVSENERLSALFHQAPGFMAALRGPTHIIEMANDAYRALVGSTRDIFGKPILEAIPEAADQGFITLLDNVYSSGKAFVGRASPLNLAREPNQPTTEMYVDFIYQPIFDASNQVTGVMVQGHEVTEAYLARQSLLAADRQKDHFIAILSHELRNPLAPIRTAARLLTLPNLPPSTIEKATSVIERQAEQMAKLLDDLLDVARISRNQISLRKERVSLETIISMAVEAARPLIDRKNHDLTVHQHGFIELYGDLVRLTQIVSNLITNAAKYTDSGGKITVSTARQGGECTIVVKDNGLGIGPEALPTIFDMFSQVQEVIGYSEGGLGIGLSLVKGLVQLHAGNVSAASEGEGKGSTFTIALPCLSATESRGATLDVTTTRAATTPLKILVADDNVDFAETLSCFLETRGHQVFFAADGVQAFELAKREQPDVAVLDIGMPGMSGYELAAAIRKQDWGQRITLVAATGWGAEDDQNRTKSAGFDTHLTKPFAMERIEEVLQNFLT
jgi:signal transduction histidine kinase/CheY-like chemotaxis protein